MSTDSPEQQTPAGSAAGIKKSSRTTAAVMICTGISRILGFLRMLVFAYFFGSSGLADVVQAVFHIPNSLRMLFAEGALSSAYIPQLSSALIEDPSGKRARTIVQNLFGFLILLLIPLLGMSVVFAHKVVPLLLSFKEAPLWDMLHHYFPGYFRLPKMELAIDLFRWMVWYLFLISISAVLLGALNARKVFVIPAITPILFSVTVIASLYFVPLPIHYRMIVGILTGGIAQVFFQLPAFFKKKFTILPSFRFNNEDFKKIRNQWIPVVVSASIFSVNQLVAIFFASQLEVGSVSALSYAVVFFQLPMGIFANSIITVLFPRMSRQVVRNEIGELRNTVAYGIRYMLVLLVPATLLLVFLGEDIISITLERGEFTHAATIRATHVLTAFSIGLFSAGGFYLMQRLFYALKRYYVPLVNAGIVLLVDVGFSLLLKETTLRVIGLAAANTIAFSAGLLFLFVIARKQLGRLGGKKILITAIKTCLANIPLVIIMLVYAYFIKGLFVDSGFLVRAGVVAGVAIAAFFVTMGLCLIFKVEIVEDIVRKRVRK
ncbi:MAG: murein biosynthesis integral membrane protein MurJ [Spirochaetales bacterium]|nr:murein biosynthesis integral membrane protein MurJ [Spirochaetales bacterium]